MGASISLRSDSCIPSLRREHSEADLSIAYLNHLSITPLPQLPASHSRLIMLLRTAIRPSAFRSIAKSIPAAPIRSPFNRPVAIAFGLSLGATPFLHPRTTARLDSSPSSPQAAVRFLSDVNTDYRPGNCDLAVCCSQRLQLHPRGAHAAACE